ncbi:MAG: hypothetical protein AMJ95_00060 [Omnitrophica WOR_2 bacterium SM23_72]|nr:MAG: hypothetical protein AMJ95_00060 [Omnitrophica WOR_2 bacterium SM23_72]
MKKTRFAVIGLVVFLLTTGALYAQPVGEEKGPRDGPKGRIVQALNLTPEQESRLEENRKAQRQEMKRLHEAVKEKHTKLQEALKNPYVTRKGVQPLANEIKSLHAQLIDSRINGIFAVKEILTSEQFARFQEITEKQQEHVKKRQEHIKERFLQWRDEKFGRGKGQDMP